MRMITIGNKKDYAISYAFDEDTLTTSFSMFIQNMNVFAYTYKNVMYTANGNLDDLTDFLTVLPDNMTEDPYPVKTEGVSLAEMDCNAREFESKDEEEYSEYYRTLYNWNLSHRLQTACNDLIVPNIYFRLMEDCVEISWDNRYSCEDIVFGTEHGSALIQSEVFRTVTKAFVREYVLHWYA